MASLALRRWLTTQRAELDRFESALRAARAAHPAARQQLTDAYLVLLAGCFQRFCRDLHREAVIFAAAQVRPAGMSPVVSEALRHAMALDRGNAQPSAVSADFDRFGLDLWAELVRRDSANQRRRRHLEELNVWRSAIAHQQFRLRPAHTAVVAGTTRSLTNVRRWRASCSALARHIDAVICGQLTTLTGNPAW
jgi:hypothetical protein